VPAVRAKASAKKKHASTSDAASKPKRMRHNPDEPTSDDWKKMSVAKFTRARDDFNPYAHPKISPDHRFHSRMQFEIYDSIICSFQYPVVVQQHFDLDYLHEYYSDAMEVLEFHGQDKLMSRKVDYSPELIKEFFAMVYFHKDEEKTMTWMSAVQQCTRNLARFASLLGFEIPDEDDRSYCCIHDNHQSVHNCHPALHVAYPDGCGARNAPSVTKMKTSIIFSTRSFATLLPSSKEIRNLFVVGSSTPFTISRKAI
jgi:hypothetical protein